MSSISPAIRTASTVTGDLKLGNTTKKKKWPLVALAGPMCLCYPHDHPYYSSLYHNYFGNDKNELPYVVYTGYYREEGGVIYLPLYMVPLL